MTQADLLVLLKRDLEIVTTYMDQEAVEEIDAQLTVYLSAAARFIETEGIALDTNDVGDALLLVMYAGWLYEKRKAATPNDQMPRMLRWNLNNRLFSQDVRESRR